jgi:glycosyltransferase involved in cell wall biosynthesis
VRLGLLIYGSIDTLSGGYLYDRRLAAHLRKAGDSVEIVSLPWRSYPRHLMDNFDPALAQRLQRLEVDGLLQDELNHPSLFYLNRRLKNRLGYPIISIVHHLRSSEAHPALLKVLYREIERGYLNSVDGFIYNSQTTRQVAAGFLKRERPGVVAFPAGDRFSPGALIQSEFTAGPLRLLFLGNVIRRKGLDWVLQELALLPPESWQLDVVGSLGVEPAYAAALQDQVHRMGAEGQVRFHGALSDAETAVQLQASQVLVVPSSYEGFGIVYLEAMGFGVVPVGSTLGAAGEIIEDGRSGFLVRPGQTGELRQVLESLSGSRERLMEMSRAARQRFLTFPTWEDSMEKARRFIEQFVQDWRVNEHRHP